MALYDNLASVYDELFPESTTSTPFLAALAPEGPRRSLDLGSATGTELIALARLGWEGIGLEPNRAMLALAREKIAKAGLAEMLRFEEGVMEDAAGLFPVSCFGLVLCLGNTIPHLGKPLADFLPGMRNLLAPGGALVLQLLNYDRILAALAPERAGSLFTLPEIRSPRAIFRRYYRTGKEGQLSFLTELSVDGAAFLSDEILLRPIQPALLESALREAGFGRLGFFSSWEGAGFREDRDPFIIAVAR